MTDFSRKYNEVISGKFEGNELMFQFFDEKKISTSFFTVMEK